MQAPELNFVEIPVVWKGVRTVKRIPIAPLHEVLQAELDELGLVDSIIEDNDWADSFLRHPHKEIPGDTRPVHPIALYVDGIKFTRAIGPSRSDSLVALTAYNLRTQRRHLVAVLSKRESCGYESLYPILHHITWSLIACTRGERPRERWDKTAWPEGSVYGDLQNTPMSARFLLCQVKADWAEFCSAFGLPTWQSHHSPCFLCGCSKPHMFDFSGVTLDDDMWGDKPNSYDSECAKNEVRVTIATEDDRRMILEWGGLHTEKKNKKAMGRVLARSVPCFKLQMGDRLEPSPDLQHSALFEVKELPFEAIFWRLRRDRKNRVTSWVNRRCPIFCSEIGVSPQGVLHLDTLHTLYSGVFNTFVYTVLRACLDEDIYQLGGSKGAREDATLERLLND